MAASGTGPRKAPFEPQAPGFLKVWPPNYYRDRLPEGTTWEEVNRFCARMVEDVIVGEDASTVAAVVVEPIGNTGGIITPTDEYFQILREICDRHNVLLIFDEVITFGKTGNLFAAQTFGVVPDIIVSGKGLSSGAFPLAVMVAKPCLAKAFQEAGDAPRFFAHGQTTANAPVGCAVGLAVLEEMERDGLVTTKAQRLGNLIRCELKQRLARFNVVREIRGKGVLLGVELVRDVSVPERQMQPYPELGLALKKTALEAGLLMRIDPSWFAVAPALIAEERDIRKMCGLIEHALENAIKSLN